MGNYSVYLNADEKTKINNIAASCEVPKGNVLRVIVKAFDESYLKELVQNYKNQL